MSIRTISPGETDALRAAQLSDKLEGHPTIGVHVGGGRHVGMPATWQGVGNSPGWSSNEFAVDGASFRACNGATWLLVNGAAPNLTAQERSELVALYTPARRFSTRFSVRFW